MWQGSRNYSMYRQVRPHRPWAQALFATYLARLHLVPVWEGSGGAWCLMAKLWMDLPWILPRPGKPGGQQRCSLPRARRAGSSSTGSPPPPSPPPPPSQPPSVSTVSPAPRLVAASAANLSTWSSFYLLQCLTDIHFVNSQISLHIKAIFFGNFLGLSIIYLTRYLTGPNF